MSSSPEDGSKIARLAVVILAAGAARRFGRPKQLERWPTGGPTLVERAVKLAVEAQVGLVYVVTGNQHEQVTKILGESQITTSEVKLVYNPRWEEGQGFSVARGVQEIQLEQPKIEGILFMLADQPRLKVSTLSSLANHFLEPGTDHKASIVFPTFEGKRGNPVVFGQAFFEELSQLEGDVGGRAVVRNHSEAVREIAVNDPAIHEDVDKPDLRLGSSLRAWKAS